MVIVNHKSQTYIIHYLLYSLTCLVLVVVVKHTKQFSLKTKYVISKHT